MADAWQTHGRRMADALLECTHARLHTHARAHSLTPRVHPCAAAHRPCTWRRPPVATWGLGAPGRAPKAEAPMKPALQSLPASRPAARQSCAYSIQHETSYVSAQAPHAASRRQ
eukprot:164903-Chlamydomonas_euryale.AAC.1